MRSGPNTVGSTLLQPADDLLRKPADDATAAFTTTTAPGIPAIVATCRPHEPWVMHSADDLDNAVAASLAKSGAISSYPGLLSLRESGLKVAWRGSITRRRVDPSGLSTPTTHRCRCG